MEEIDEASKLLVVEVPNSSTSRPSLSTMVSLVVLNLHETSLSELFGFVGGRCSSTFFSLYFVHIWTCMRIWSRTSTGRLVRKPSSPLENMVENQVDRLTKIEDNRSQNNDQDQARTLRDFMNPTRTGAPSCIFYPPDASHFHFKPGIIQLLPNFHGLEAENLYLHLREFEEVCNIRNVINCSMNTIRLKLFPFSLKEKAKTWLQNLRP
ncbi:hypothetical protein LWI28_014864 [Acer negundo]|uniref:Uncharacterized protein n=1 Tax=Acer negundo TaxID=4023 RepID=A0AAD5J5Y5_ACENE|nr:hypothetical protein LWI28_014864 [Acer negundo]